jgi:hypothetical protein
MTDHITATIGTRANVYFDGKCVSHGITLADGTEVPTTTVRLSLLKAAVWPDPVQDQGEHNFTYSVLVGDGRLDDGVVVAVPGNADDDGWLQNPLAANFRDIPNYVAFYNAINNDNRWGSFQNGLGELFESPRSIRLGIRAEL